MRKKNKKLKFGDIVRIDLNEDDLYYEECGYMISIYPNKKFSECNDFFDIATLTRGKDIEYIAGSYVKSISKATEVEKRKLFKRLAKAGKYWNTKKKCLEDIKPAQKIIQTYQDLIDKKVKITGSWIDNCSAVRNCNVYVPADLSCKNMASSEKIAKSMLAMAMISQLMPYYGGAVTTKEWSDSTIKKYIIGRRDKDLYVQCAHKMYSFLAFHTSEQRDKFLAKNEELIKTYFMI